MGLRKFYKKNQDKIELSKVYLGVLWLTISMILCNKIYGTWNLLSVQKLVEWGLI